MCGWSAQTNQKSPDRLDALVWAVTDLLVQEEQIVIDTHYTSGYQISPI
jgi:phage terminase large subunit-like protein